MTVEADTARTFRTAAREMQVDSSVILSDEVGFHRYGIAEGSKILLSYDPSEGRRKLAIRWRERTQRRELVIVGATTADRIDDVDGARRILFSIADALDAFASQPRRESDRRTLAMCAAITSVQCHLTGIPGSQVRIWAATPVSPPSIEIGTGRIRLERFLGRFLKDSTRPDDPTAHGYRRTRASMILLPKEDDRIDERFGIRGLMDAAPTLSGGGAVEAMRQTSLARSFAHPIMRPVPMIEEALEIAGA